MIKLVQSKLAVRFAVLILMAGYAHCALEYVEVSRIERSLESQPLTPHGCDDPNCICHGATLVDEACEDQIDVVGSTSGCRFVRLDERLNIAVPAYATIILTSPSICVMQQSFQL